MFKHLLRLTWNKKRQNFLLLLEIFIAFLGLFAGFTFLLYPYNNYKIPLGLKTENVWVVNYQGGEAIRNIDSLQLRRQAIKSALLSINQVEDVTYSSMNVPFSGNGFNGAVTYNGNEVWAQSFVVEDNYAKLLGVEVLEGRWFTKEDQVSKDKLVVINEELKKQLFDDKDALGQIVTTDTTTRMKIIGVVSSFKDESEFEKPGPGFFHRMDTTNMREYIAIMIKVEPGADVALESTVFKTLSNNMKNTTIKIEHLDDMKAAKNRNMRVPFTLMIVISSFLLINVALGIFGVLWYNIQKRKGEIGLRRAVGATGSSISKQLITEAILLATLALILGLFFAVQFPLLKTFNLPVNNYVISIILSIVTIYLLVIICAWYPGKQAAGIYPSTALHED